QYNQDVVRISGVDIPIKKGKPAVDLPEIKCQDFMSAKDCQIMFNVCDPVTCPSSRCDFGGRYPVENVIQSGIIGSVALCLPNWNEGIYVPVCLSGVNAGLESLIQVGEGYSQCLQTSLDKGETVGICDEVHSVYACEFLWSQATPLLEVAATKLSEKTHYGGGEYFSFLEMFDTAQQSANFFTQYYAEDSYKAFKARSTSDIGTSFCKAFKYLSFPEGMNLIDSITQPDSPNQFSGHFDEIPLNTITNPPTSHYKVFYHIYAGGDSAAYYRVYLKEGTESSFYNDPIGIELVDSGYIPLGESVIETKDFIAPAGFQTMCVNVNGIEKCGFKQISTSFSVEYMEDIYLSQQGKEKNIKTEKECISGSVNALSLLNPNIQSGVNDLISPEIYNQGLIRVCSTDDPGKGTDTLAGENARWQEVGYCDDPKLKCWIDKQSVKDVIYATNLENKTLEELNEDQQKILESEGTITKAFGDEIKKIEDEESPSIKINLLNNLFDKVHFNNQKAYLYLKRGEVYTVLALKEYLTSPESEKENVDFEIKPFSETEEQEIFESYLTRNNLKLNDKGEIVNEDGELVEIEQEILNLKDEHQSQINEEIPIEETSSEEIFVEETLPGETFVETEKIYSPEEATERQLKLIELSKKDFKEYCDTAAEVAGDFYCARYVTQAFDYWFGYGRSYFLGVRGDAWSFNESMLNSGGKIIIPNEDYSNLREGDLIGFKRKWDNSKYKEQAYTHVGFYLGKFDDKNAVAHKLGNTPKISTIESILQMEGGVRTISWLNTILPGSYFDIKEKWNIAVVIRPDQNKLYIPLETYIEQKELEEEEYIVQSDDTLFKVASKYYPDNLSEINILMWLIREGNNIISNELVVGEAIKIYIPKKEVIVEGEIEGEISKEPIVVQPIVDSSDGYGAVVRVLRGFRRSTEESNAWAKAITESLESNNLETNVMNSLVVLTFMERESSIKAIPATRLVEECDSAAFFDDPKVSLGCTTFKSEIEKASVDDGVVDEKEYVNMKKFLVSLNSLRPLYSAGSMQVAVPTALQLVRSGENIDEDNIYDVLLTVEGGAEFGVRYVKSLIDLYVPKNGDLKDNLAFIFSDYNSGLGSSRNAAFQDQINTLNTNLGNPELELSLDGKLGPASIKAIENIVGKDVHETLKLNNNELIIGSTSPVLEDRTFYIEIKQKYYSLTGKTPDYAIVPELEYSAAGITSKLSVRKYTSGSFCFMVGQCVKAESCPTDLLTEVIENILEEYEKAWGKECSNLKSYISSNPEQYNSLGFS
ncbi:DUF1615 family protein, partial [Candidatus Pacearchaeota archaeon]|nr:DUF1615 family protein [Candidatus Pacearchaeota archaeon]